MPKNQLSVSIPPLPLETKIPSQQESSQKKRRLERFLEKLRYSPESDSSDEIPLSGSFNNNFLKEIFACAICKVISPTSPVFPGKVIKVSYKEERKEVEYVIQAIFDRVVQKKFCKQCFVAEREKIKIDAISTEQIKKKIISLLYLEDSLKNWPVREERREKAVNKLDFYEKNAVLEWLVNEKQFETLFKIAKNFPDEKSREKILKILEGKVVFLRVNNEKSLVEEIQLHLANFLNNNKEFLSL